MIVYINRNVTVSEIERNIPVMIFDGEWFFGFFFNAFFDGEPHVAFWVLVKLQHLLSRKSLSTFGCLFSSADSKLTFLKEEVAIDGFGWWTRLIICGSEEDLIW